MAVELPNISWAVAPRGYPEEWVTPSVGDVKNYWRSRDLGVVPTHAEVLHGVASEVGDREVATGGLTRIVRKLHDAAAAERAGGRNLVGLAAPQVGEGLRILLAKVAGQEELTAFVNPVITDVGPDAEKASEGCFSCAGAGGDVVRPSWLEVARFDEHGDYCEPQRFEGFDARVLGHEIDHLDGWLVPDRILEAGDPILWIPAEALRRDEQGASAYGRYMQSPEPREPWPFVVPTEQWTALSVGHLTMGDFTLPKASNNE